MKGIALTMVSLVMFGLGYLWGYLDGHKKEGIKSE